MPIETSSSTQQRRAEHDAHPLRYKRFIVSGDDSHTAVQTPLFYSQEVNGFPLHLWTKAFVKFPFFWFDLVDDFEPLP